MIEHARVKDTFNDALIVSTHEKRVGIANVYVTIEGDDGEPCAALAPSAAREVALGILKAVGEKVVPIKDLKSAKDVSFNEGMLRLAAIHKRQVTFRYAKGDGGFIEQRNLNPERVEDDGESVIGRDPDRDDVRRYRLDRIKGEVSFA